MPGVLARFSHSFPGIEVQLHEGIATDMVQRLTDGELDAAFCLADDGGVPDQLASRRLSREEVVAAFAPGHAPRAASIAIGDLVSAPVIALRRGSAITSAVERQAIATGHELHLSLESGDPVLLRALAARNFATAILPRSISSPDGPPIEIRSLRPAIMLSVLLAWRRHHDITPAAGAFVRFVLAEIAPPTTMARR